MRYAVVMAGGSGTRLWPLSRGSRPKQMLQVVGGRSLLRIAYERLAGLVEADHSFVCTGSAHLAAVAAELPELPAANMLGEPARRDTAAAVGLSCAVLERSDPDAVVAFVTADHVIGPIARFQEAVRAAFEIVETHPAALVTFGITPTSAQTGLGYIEVGASLADDPRAAHVVTFTEKPDAQRAADYVASGRFLWNSGMFVWRADTLLAALARWSPATVEGLRRAAAAWDTPERDAVLAEIYGRLTPISVDYAVLEPSARAGAESSVLVVPMRVDWLDVGSWPALARTLQSDTKLNVRDGAAVLVDSQGNIVVSDDPDHLVAAVGLTDTIIVHTKDVTMVCPKAAAERVKDLVGYVEAAHGARYA